MGLVAALAQGDESLYFSFPCHTGSTCAADEEPPAWSVERQVTGEVMENRHPPVGLLMWSLGLPKELNMLSSMSLGDSAPACFQFYPISHWN